jgi:hypothetical protein
MRPQKRGVMKNFLSPISAARKAKPVDSEVLVTDYCIWGEQGYHFGTVVDELDEYI